MGGDLGTKSSARDKDFLWLLAHGKLLSNHNKWRRGIAADPRCSICEESEEYNSHAIRDCTEARRVCERLVPLEFQANFFLLQTQDWVEWNISDRGLQKANQNRKIRFAIASWCIWRWRNEYVFCGRIIDDYVKVEKIIEYEKENVIAWKMLRKARGEMPIKDEVLKKW